MNTRYTKQTLRDEYGVKRNFDGTRIGRVGDIEYFVTDNGRLVAYGDGNIITVFRDDDDIETCVTDLADRDAAVAGAIIDALGIDIEVPL